jgi:hypothetical protein
MARVEVGEVRFWTERYALSKWSGVKIDVEVLERRTGSGG